MTNSPMKITRCLALLFLICALAAMSVQGQTSEHGVIKDERGNPIAQARVNLLTSQNIGIQETLTNESGAFSFRAVPAGAYLLKISAAGFQSRQTGLEIKAGEVEPVIIVLGIAQVREEITVTASRGAALSTDKTAQLVLIKEQSEIQERPLPTIGNALEGSTGVLVQQSAPAQVSPFLRGLTGYHVLNLIDGIRFNNSTFRSGPNQYLAFIEPGQAERIELLLGPTGSQYGSDSLGGTINLLTLQPTFSESLRFRGELQTMAASADSGASVSARVNLSGKNFAWIFGGSLRRHNDLRAGQGVDSHQVFHKFFGLSHEQVRQLYGNRQQDTGFSQYGWHSKLALRLRAEQNLTLWYQQSDATDVRGYKDLWGGLGRLQSAFDPQGLRFFYARYDKLKTGFLDSLTGAFSINSQRDGTVRQGLLATGLITRDDSTVNVLGYTLQGTTHLGTHQALNFGGEIYHEKIASRRWETNPLNGNRTARRALYPNGSRYTTTALYVQDSLSLIREKLRAVAGGRFTGIRFRAFADRNLTATGMSLGVVDARQGYEDLTFNSNLIWQARQNLAFNFLVGRGFRAPNLNDLGALGLNDLGFEIPAADAVSSQAFIGVSDGEGVLSSGKAVKPLSPERLFNFEFGLTFRSRKFYSRAHVFDAELQDPIVRRTLVFDATNAPTTLAGIPVTVMAPSAAQRAQGVVNVATAFDARAVKAFVNEGEIRYYGFDWQTAWSLSSGFVVEGNYAYLVGRELNPNRFVRRLPPQHAVLSLRYQPLGSRYWGELSGNFSGRQERLSGGDLTDERIGAARRRRDISDFFNGSLARGLINAGGDGVFGTSDDRFAPTNETLAQIGDRVLPLGAIVNGVKIVDDNTRVPLYVATPGFAVLNLRGGIRLSEQLSVNGGVFNLFDKNYRYHGSGVDAPGRNFFAGLKISF
ncbi:MAG: TonB-dependent receptor [Acidobacteriota bacterium]